MNWPAIFLGCFLTGFFLSALSFALSAVGLHFHVHMPLVHRLHLPAPHLASGGHASVGPVNFATIMAFLAWFGGAGYLLTSQFGWLALPSLVAATLVGIIGAAIVFWIMVRVLWSPHEIMQAADYCMIGVLGRLSHAIRSGGTGELLYSLGGVRHSCSARSADGTPIDKGEEVVVTAYERGVAHVRRWEDLAAGKS
jgi:hypothetical protein